MTADVITEQTVRTNRRSDNGAAADIPPLENGDRLTRAEFHRRYEAMPENVKAELIDGVVYMASPVRVKNHGRPHGRIMLWLGNYQVATPGTDYLDNVTLRLDPDNEPQPDAVLRIQETHGGKSFVSEDDCLEGTPELIVEVAASTASYDSHQKKNIYRRNQIQEYIVWRVRDRKIDWFSLQDDEYVRLEPDANGIIQSLFFVGLRLNVSALINDDIKSVLVSLQEGLASPQHAEFVQKLAAQATWKRRS